MTTTKIEWADATWNPVRGCSRVSEGCGSARGGGCYAERIAARFSGPGQPYEGLASRETGRWTGKVRLVPEVLDAPLRWRKPHRVFVNSMSDLFHEALTNEQIAAVFGVMATAPQHVYQCLTKRPERMREWFEWAARQSPDARHMCVCRAWEQTHVGSRFVTSGPWPLPSVWLGVSVEDQPTANERIPLLLATPAAVRWVSAEPMIGPVNLNMIPDPGSDADERGSALRALDWIVVGGESGPRARPFDLAWARSVIAQCRAAGVACFVKQDSGGRPGQQGRFSDEEWRIKEFPMTGGAT